MYDIYKKKWLKEMLLPYTRVSKNTTLRTNFFGCILFKFLLLTTQFWDLHCFMAGCLLFALKYYIIVGMHFFSTFFTLRLLGNWLWCKECYLEKDYEDATRASAYNLLYNANATVVLDGDGEIKFSQPYKSLNSTPRQKTNNQWNLITVFISYVI